MFMPKNTEKMSLQEQVQLLMDERAVRNVILRLCRATDRADLDLLKTCFFDDAIDHHWPFFECTGAELFDKFLDNVGTTAMMQYNVGSLLIEVDGDVAKTESYVWSAKRMHETTKDGDPLYRISGLRYIDRLKRRDGEWRILEHWFVPEWGFFQDAPALKGRVGPFVPASEQTMPPVPSRRDKTDISYTI